MRCTSRSASWRIIRGIWAANFHPSSKSKPLEPHPLFRAFIGRVLEHRAGRMDAAREAAEIRETVSRN